MHLVTITSEEENYRVGGILVGFGEEPRTNFIWTGLNDRALDEKWEWSYIDGWRIDPGADRGGNPKTERNIAIVVGWASSK